MLMFYIGEYGHMLVSSALIATFFLGGYGTPFYWVTRSSSQKLWQGGWTSVRRWPACFQARFFMSSC